MSWLNKKTGVFHAHSFLTGAEQTLTGCGRVVLWGKSYDLRPDFEYKKPGPGDRLCSHCVSVVQYQIDFRQEWLDAMKEEQE